MSVRNISSNQVMLDGCAASSSLHDVVIVVEKTSALGSYLPELKASYLLPTLENFNGSPFDDKDYGSLSTSSVYTLVVFEAADRVGRPLYECYGPFTSPHKIVSTLEKIQFQDGAGEFHSQIADGLAAALLCLDDVHLLREPGLTPNKHCILICNSPPYSMPVMDVPGYQDLGLDQLTNLMLERLVNLSIISPRKIPSLLGLFEKAGGDLGMMKNFSKDPRHLVLLRGFGLQERIPSPTPMQQSVPLEQQQMQYRQNQPRPSAPQQQQQQQPIQMQPILRPGVQERPRLPMQQQQPMRWQNTMQAAQMQPAQMQNPQMQVGQLQQNQMQQQQGPMLTNQFQQNVQLQQQNANMMQMKQLQQSGIMQPGMGMGMQQGVPVQGQPMQQNQQNPPQVIMAPQQNQGMMQPGQSMQQQQPQQMQNPQDGPAMQQASKERLLIWNGILEWQEKSSRAGDQNKVVRSVQCKISSAVLNGETEVKADNWPPKLLMQLIPKTLVSNLGGAYFKNARSVLFHPNPGEALDNLARVMSSGYAGCVHFNSSQTGQLCDIKVLMLLYSADKQAYVGFIPVDQAGFVERIRKVIQQQKNRQLGMTEVAQPNQVLPGQPQPGVSGMMVAQTANLGMGAGQMTANQGQQDPTQIPQITLQQANNPGMMNNPAQAQLVRPTGNTQQRQQLMETERQHNLLRIQQLQRELNEKQQREQLFQAQQEQQFTVVQIQNQPGMQQRPTGISVAGMQQNLQQQQQQQQQRMMRPNVPTNPGLRHLLQQNPMGQARMGQPNMGGVMGGMNPQGPPFDDALFDLLQ